MGFLLLSFLPAGQTANALATWHPAPKLGIQHARMHYSVLGRVLGPRFSWGLGVPREHEPSTRALPPLFLGSAKPLPTKWVLSTLPGHRPYRATLTLTEAIHTSNYDVNTVADLSRR
jgi:hypothetical protein